MNLTLNKNAPGSANVGERVAVFFCWGWCGCYRTFELIDEDPASPRYSLKCEGCRFTIPGSWCHIRQHPDEGETRTYGKPYLCDAVYAIGAARMTEESRWRGYSDAPPDAVMITDELVREFQARDQAA